MAIATAKAFGYRRRSPDVLANLILAVALLGVCLVGWELSVPGQRPALAGRHGSEGRSLLQLPQTTDTSTLFPSPPPPGPPQPKHFTGAEKFCVIFYIGGVLYCLLGFAVVCEEYFVASLLVLGDKFHLSDDVNGATLMAAGSSMPEVFSSFVALANPNTDNSLGMATVVGSSVYNILVIIGWSAIAGKDIMLDWKPLVRDSCFYFMTIIYLIITFTTGYIHLGNSLVALFLYACYVAFMTQNHKAFAKMDQLAERYVPYLHRKTQERLALKAAREAKPHGPMDSELLPLAEFDAAVMEKELDDSEAVPGGADALVEPGHAGHHEGEEEDPLQWPGKGSLAAKLRFCIKAPLLLAFKYTVPDCKKEKWANYYWFTFALSIVWIGILAWYMVEWASHVSCVMRIPEIIIGLTVLAAGTSLPDTLSSVIVARKGLGDMAVANAIGSNVFNVLFGLGMPWTIWIMYSGQPIYTPVNGLRENAFTMLAVGFFYMACFTLRGFHSTKRMGQAFIGIYFLYVLMIFIRYTAIDKQPQSTTCV